MGRDICHRVGLCFSGPTVTSTASDSGWSQRMCEEKEEA